MTTDDPKLPQIRIRILEDRTATSRCDVGFLKLRRLTLENVYPDGRTSAPYPYDLVDRAALDAAVIVLHRGAGDATELCLRSSLRPPLGLSAGAQESTRCVLWELPAGLIEPEEAGSWEGILACAARETTEETGFVVPEDRFERLGAPTYLSPGVLAEQLYYVHASVDDAERGEATLDGSPVEEGSELRFVRVAEAIAAIDRGEVADAKTEVAIRRFAALLRDGNGGRSRASR